MVNTVSQDMKIMLIKKQGCFSALTDQEIIELSELFTEQNIKQGEVIVKEGDIVDSVFLIVEGKADVLKTIYEDDVPTVNSLAILGPDNAIGLSKTGFYSLTGVRTATVVALTPMLLLRLSVPAYHGFSLVHSHVNEEMLKKVEADYLSTERKKFG